MHKIRSLSRIRQRIGRIGKASGCYFRYFWKCASYGESKMKKLLSLCLLALASAQTKRDVPSTASTNKSQTIEIIRNGSHSATEGPAQNFTGSVQVDQLFPAKDLSRVSGGVVTFEPGARSAWHTHPLGQILIVTAGVGRVQAWGGPIQVIRAGRCGADFARRKTLARRVTHDSDDTYCDSGSPQWQSG